MMARNIRNPEAEKLAEAIEAADTRCICREPCRDCTGPGEPPRAGPALDSFVTKAGIGLVPVDAEQAAMARSAFARFGKGRHPAGLNFGDCFAYALAKVSGDSLLFKGKDFSRTDILVHAAIAGP